MSDTCIDIRSLTKRFRIYDRPMDMLREQFTGKSRHRSFTALDDVNFQVRKGEVVGVIGRNGAGKSTLLRIISGVLDASEGKVDVRGKVSSILELGTGFHSEYTGRKNILMGGMCLGMSRAEVLTKMQSIIDFSELESVIDQPFRTYSSGMQARLTFSVALSVEPEVFIIDEALAAGDQVFVDKCLHKIQEIINNGTTVLFVSHSTNLVRKFCSRAIFLEKGKIRLDGDPEYVCREYDLEGYRLSEKAAEDGRRQGRIGTGEARIVDVAILKDHAGENALWGRPLVFRMVIESTASIENVCMSVVIEMQDRRHVCSLWSGRHLTDWSGEASALRFDLKPGLTTVELTLHRLMLNAGTYAVTPSLYPCTGQTSSKMEMIDMLVRCTQFSVENVFTGPVNDSIIEPVSSWRIAPSSPALEEGCSDGQ